MPSYIEHPIEIVFDCILAGNVQFVPLVRMKRNSEVFQVIFCLNVEKVFVPKR